MSFTHSPITQSPTPAVDTLERFVQLPSIDEAALRAQVPVPSTFDSRVRGKKGFKNLMKSSKEWLGIAQTLVNHFQTLSDSGVHIPEDVKASLDTHHNRLQWHYKLVQQYTAERNRRHAFEQAEEVRNETLALWELGESTVTRVLQTEAGRQRREQILKAITSRQRLQASMSHDMHDFPTFYPSLRADNMVKIVNWLSAVREPWARQVLWLNGPLRSGKSTMLHFLHKMCKDVNILSGTFVFPPMFSNGWFLSSFVPTLLSSLMESLPRFKDALTAVVSDPKLNIELVLVDNMQNQAKQLFQAAWRRMPASDRKRPFIFLLDGLERCEGVGIKRATNFIKACINVLPFQFIVTSSSADGEECTVRETFTSQGLMPSVQEVVVEDYLSALERHQSEAMVKAGVLREQEAFEEAQLVKLGKLAIHTTVAKQDLNALNEGDTRTRVATSDPDLKTPCLERQHATSGFQGTEGLKIISWHGDRQSTDPPPIYTNLPVPVSFVT